jgi:APA family basic amino acid/polyamine antiporter
MVKIAITNCGLLTVVAAVSYGELSAMFPKAGGQYVYIKEAYMVKVSIWLELFCGNSNWYNRRCWVAFSKFCAYLFRLLVIKIYF